MEKETKKFIWNLLIFLALFVICLIFVNKIYIEEVISQKNIYKNQEQFRESQENQLDVVFFGDSHVAMAANPQHINSSFNYAVPTEKFDKIFYKVRKILRSKNSPNVYVFQLDVHSLLEDRGQPPPDLWFWVDFMSLSELSKFYKQPPLEIFLKTKLPVIGNGRDFITLFFNQQRTEFISGWEKSEVRFNNSGDMVEQGLINAREHIQSYPSSFDENLLVSAIKTVELIETENKTAVFVRYPLTQEYMDGLDKIGFDVDSFYENLTTYLNSSNVIFLDYHKLFADRPELFFDSHHLNMYGAEIFSKKINDDLKPIVEKERNKVHTIFLN